MKDRYLSRLDGITLDQCHHWGLRRLLNPRIDRGRLSLSGRKAYKNKIIVASPAFKDWEDFGATTTRLATRNVDPENHLMGYS